MHKWTEGTMFSNKDLQTLGSYLRLNFQHQKSYHVDMQRIKQTNKQKIAKPCRI